MSAATRSPTRRPFGQLALVAMVAALVLLAARDATRAELRECHGLIAGVMTDAPAGVRAVAAAIAAVVRDLGKPERDREQGRARDRAQDRVHDLALPALGHDCGLARTAPPPPHGAHLALASGACLLRPAQLDLPPPRA